MKTSTIWIAVGVAIIVVAGVAAIAVQLWGIVGTSTISLGGWLALGFGIVATLALGIALMSLMFVSDRYGYDDQNGKKP